MLYPHHHCRRHHHHFASPNSRPRTGVLVDGRHAIVFRLFVLIHRKRFEDKQELEVAE